MEASDKQPFIPIYKQLFTEYKENILMQEYQAGDRIPSINELMHKHEVSRETAKHVLKMLADEGLIVQKPGMGSFVAERGPMQEKWGVIVPFLSTYIEELIHNIQIKANERGRELVYFIDYNNYHEEMRLVSQLINERFEAVIVIPVADETRTAYFYTKLQTGGTIVTLLDRTMAGSYFQYVIQSYDLGVCRAAQYLLDNSAGTLAYVKNNFWLGRNLVQEVMESTFQNYIAENRSNRKSIVLNDSLKLDRSFIEQNQITGFFCGDDSDAVRIIGRLKAWGYQIPADISIVSYGNTELAKYFTPAITSIDSHVDEMAETAARIIQEHQAGRDVRYSQYVLSPQLVKRET